MKEDDSVVCVWDGGGKGGIDEVYTVCMCPED